MLFRVKQGWKIVFIIFFFSPFSFFAKNIVPIGFLLSSPPSSPSSVTHVQNTNQFNKAIINYLVKSFNDRNPFFTIHAHLKYVRNEDSFRAKALTCEFIEMGVVAIFGPTIGSSIASSLSSASCLQNRFIVESIASSSGLINFQTVADHWSENHVDDIGNTKNTINLHPTINQMAHVFADLVQDLDWKSFTILYENLDGLLRLQKVLQLKRKSELPFVVRQLTGDNRPILKEMFRNSENNIIVDCATDRILEILQQANEVNMLGDYQSYILTSLDSHTIDYSLLKGCRSNITIAKLIVDQNSELTQLRNDWVFDDLYSIDKIKTETALIYDSFKLFTMALNEIDLFKTFLNKTIKCKNRRAAATSTFSVNRYKDKQGHHQQHLIDLLKTKNVRNALTGRIIMNEKTGRRDDLSMDIWARSINQFRKVATWNSISGLNLTLTEKERYSDIVESINSKVFYVASRIGRPFLMFKPSISPNSESLAGDSSSSSPSEERISTDSIKAANNRLEGYSKDLIDGISKILNFTYQFYLVPDGRYGSYNKQTKKWDGLIKELLERKADLAICDLTITYERRSVVDFTMPFMTLGISILYTKPPKQIPELFSFRNPLSSEVWMYTITAYLIVSLCILFVARMGSDDWENPHPCDLNSDELENTWNLKNCLWLTMGSMMGQGCDILPKGLSSRIVTGLFWFFALIMISSYTANLAAFLTTQLMDESIDNADDLVKQSKIKYGAVKGGSTSSFFKNSNFTTYQKMWSFMETARPSVFPASNQEGVERVLKSKRTYAFLMESTSIEYEVERNCELRQVGGLMDSKGYGIAMPFGSPYRTAISAAVLRMQEEGKLFELKNKWWKEMYKGESCEEENEVKNEQSSSELGIENVGGVFLVLTFGVVLAFIISIIEFLWHVRRISVDELVPFSVVFWTELRFSLSLFKETKPVHEYENGMKNCNESDCLESSPKRSKTRLYIDRKNQNLKSSTSINSSKTTVTISENFCS